MSLLDSYSKARAVQAFQVIMVDPSNTVSVNHFFGPAERMVILSNGCIRQHHGTQEFEQLGTRYRLAASVELSLDLQHVTTFIAA